MTKGKEMRFQDLLRTVIVEQSRMDVLADKLTKADKGKKPLLTPEELFALVVADPQTKVAEGVDIYEIPLSATVNNHINQAIITNVITNAVDKIYSVEFLNAGTN